MSTSPQPGHETTCKSCCESEPATAPGFPRSIAWLQCVTIGWMLVECALSLLAALQAHSVALMAFGLDSLIELLSATVVLSQYLPQFPLKRTYAERAAGVLLFLLAGAIVVIALLSYRTPMETSCLGIGITVAALVFMPVLSALKRQQARRTNDRALAADAVQSVTCAYLAGVTLLGLVVFALWHVRWIDSVAALAAVPVIVVEGRRAWRGEPCGCCAA